ncbi:hypothetical protein BGZ81_002596 [Podila clonocystis]|nr:hypothetical protein BGZ81_002596 [Podila clonocystis]
MSLEVLDQFQLLRRCPNLRRYNFGPEESRTMTVRGLTKILEEGGLSCLTYLQIEIDCED